LLSAHGRGQSHQVHGHAGSHVNSAGHVRGGLGQAMARGTDTSTAAASDNAGHPAATGAAAAAAGGAGSTAGTAMRGSGLLAAAQAGLESGEAGRRVNAHTAAAGTTAAAAAGGSAVGRLRVADAGDGGGRPDLVAFLRAFEPYGGLMVHWRLMGPSGQVYRPDNATMLSYTQCVPKAAMQAMPEFHAIPLGFMKSFTNTRHYRAGCNPHQCALDGASYVNEKQQRISTEVVHSVSWERIVVYHYVTRSIQEYTWKMARGSGHSQYLEQNRRAGRTSRGWTYFLDMNDLGAASCMGGVRAYSECCRQGGCSRCPQAAAGQAAAAGTAADSEQEGAAGVHSTLKQQQQEVLQRALE